MKNKSLEKFDKALIECTEALRKIREAIEIERAKKLIK